MVEACRWSGDWFACLDCKFLITPVCPLEGQDPMKRIETRIRMMEDPQPGGLKRQAFSHSSVHQGILIKVIYNDNRIDMVRPYSLDRLIAAGEIKKFFRSEGWVRMGVDPVRGYGGKYHGPERRRKNKHTAS